MDGWSDHDAATASVRSLASTIGTALPLYPVRLAATGDTRLWATIRAWNAPSFGVAERLGFVPDDAAATAHPEPDDGRGAQTWNRLDL